LLSSAHTRDTVFGNKAQALDRLRPWQAPKWLLYHVAELDLAVAVIPFAAFIVLTVLAMRRQLQTQSRQLEVFLVLTSAVLAWLLLLVAVYGSHTTAAPQIYERYLFYVEPLLVIAFLAWVQQSVPRAKLLTGAVALIAAVLPAAIPYKEFFTDRVWGVNSGTAGLASWAVVSNVIGSKGALFTLCVLVISALAALSFSRAEPGGTRVLVLIVVFWIGLGRVPVERSNLLIADTARAQSFGQTRTNWVDAAVGPNADVGAIWEGFGPLLQRSPLQLWETTFWNASIRHTYRLAEPSRAELGEPKLERHGRFLLRDGKRVTAGYVLVDSAQAVEGKVVARVGSLELIRVNGPLRIREHAKA
jgi:hypothetical protein